MYHWLIFVVGMLFGFHICLLFMAKDTTVSEQLKRCTTKPKQLSGQWKRWYRANFLT